VVGDPAQYLGEPGLRIDTVQLGASDQGVGDRRRLAAARGADEEKILPAEGHGLQGSFGTIVVRLKAAMVEIGPELPHAGQGIADRLGQLGLAGDLRQLGLQPALQVIDDWLGVRLPEPHPLVGWLAAPLLLDGVETGDALDRLLGDERAFGLEDVDELAPDVGHAGNFTDTAGPIELVEAGIAVGMHPALVASQVVGGMLALAIDGEPVAGGSGPCQGRSSRTQAQIRAVLVLPLPGVWSLMRAWSGRR
jgi:hypothetical protein